MSDLTWFALLLGEGLVFWWLMNGSAPDLLEPPDALDQLDVLTADLLADLEEFECDLIRAQDIDLDTPATAAVRWLGRGWSGEGS